jgi:hypothetical protein
MRVRVGSIYVFNPEGFDRFDPKTDLEPGELVRVINLSGAPPANTMGQCYVERENNPGVFTGMVSTASLSKPDGK